mmetsp:Transcript_37706/g.90223  ORF Transcript_37706/g.90223 Transcript_37706/m.90223 type:complete len:220 (-) Transcript_37706:104-763(-)
MAVEGMSSLQRHIKQKKAHGPTPTQQSKRNSFESCFSSGLDLSELSGNGSSVDRVSSSGHGARSASELLVEQRAREAVRKRAEDAADEDMDRRVRRVMDFTKLPRGDNDIKFVLPRAKRPQQEQFAAAAGSSRDDNFVRLKSSSKRSGKDDDFLASLVVSSSKNGGERGISHKSRQLKNSIGNLSKKRARANNAAASKGIKRSGKAKSVAVKKSTRSKY